MRTPHTQTHRGKTVRVVLRDGTVIIDKFEERTDKFVFLQQTGRIAKGNIKSFTVFKPKRHKTGDDIKAEK